MKKIAILLIVLAGVMVIGGLALVASAQNDSSVLETDPYWSQFLTWEEPHETPRSVASDPYWSRFLPDVDAIARQEEHSETPSVNPQQH